MVEEPITVDWWNEWTRKLVWLCWGLAAFIVFGVVASYVMVSQILANLGYLDYCLVVGGILVVAWAMMISNFKRSFAAIDAQRRRVSKVVVQRCKWDAEFPCALVDQKGILYNVGFPHYRLRKPWPEAQVVVFDPITEKTKIPIRLRNGREISVGIEFIVRDFKAGERFENLTWDFGAVVRRTKAFLTAVIPQLPVDPEYFDRDYPDKLHELANLAELEKKFPYGVYIPPAERMKLYSAMFSAAHDV